MGGALARAVGKTGSEVLLYDKDTARAEALAKEISAVAADIDAVCATDYLFLGVKPNIIGAVLAEIGGKLAKNTVLISMAAGVAIEKIESAVSGAKIIRIMPNTPVAYGRGMILYTANESVTESEVSGFLNIMAEAGTLDRLPEALIDAGSAVSGCGPAFVYMFAEALADGGVQCGLSREASLTLAAETIKGAAEMILKTGKHPEQLKDEVCSPGGSTIVGVHALEDGAFRADTAGAVIAAYEKTKKLG